MFLLEHFDFGIVDKALWRFLIICCKWRFLFQVWTNLFVCFLNMEETKKLSMLSYWDHSCPEEEKGTRSLTFMHVDPLPRSLFLLVPPPFQTHPVLHSFCSASWPLFPEYFTPVDLILPPSTQPSIAALFIPCWGYPAKYWWDCGHKISNPAPELSILQEVEWNIQLPLESRFQQWTCVSQSAEVIDI